MSDKEKTKATKVCVRAMRKIKDDIPKDCEVVLIVHCKKRKEMALRTLHKQTSFCDAINRAARRWVARLMLANLKHMPDAKYKFLKAIMEGGKVGQKSIWEKRMKGLM